MDATRANPEPPVHGVTLRVARDSDLPRLTEIYNHYIINTAVTFDLDPYTVEERRPWFEQFSETGMYQLLVADEQGRVAGFAYSGQFRPRRAYDTTVEVTVYCAPEATGRGIGTLLYSALFDAIRDEALHLAVAGITLPNAASVALHERFGFVLVGVNHEIGRKFGRYWDVGWYEKRLGA